MTPELEKSTTKPDHDGSYRTLFMQPILVQQFLETFVDPEIAKTLNFKGMETMPATFVTKGLDHTDKKELTRRYSDCIWKIPTHDKDNFLYLCLLMEFQSTEDTYMVVRIAAYIVLLYEHLINTQRKALKQTLPPMLPIVLYNGKQPWKATTSLEKLIPVKPGSILSRHQVKLEYLLIDIAGLRDDEMPDEPNFVSTIFELEQASHMNDHKLTTSLINRLIRLIKNRPVGLALREVFLIFFNGILLQRGTILETQQLKSLTEVSDMYSTMEEMLEIRMEKGLKKGMEKGLEKGMEKGMEKAWKKAWKKVWKKVWKKACRKVSWTWF